GGQRDRYVMQPLCEDAGDGTGVLLEGDIPEALVIADGLSFDVPAIRARTGLRSGLERRGERRATVEVSSAQRPDMREGRRGWVAGHHVGVAVGDRPFG